MFKIMHEGQYVTAQGTRPYLTSNERLALTFEDEHLAETARKTLERVMHLPLDIEADDFKCRNGLPFEECKCC